jgi:hypothetical protein
LKLTKELLDKRICDAEKNSMNDQTYREFIRESEDDFGLDEMDLDNMSDEKLHEYLEFLDYLWTK